MWLVKGNYLTLVKIEGKAVISDPMNKFVKLLFQNSGDFILLNIFVLSA